MQRFSFILSTFLIALVLTSCARQSAGAKSIEDYRMATHMPTKPELTATAQTEMIASTPPKDCPITVHQNPPFTPPAPYSDMHYPGEFWYGTDSLWTVVRQNGVWEALPHNPEGYTQKVFWWRDGYVWTTESEPVLTVTGERLDTTAPPLNASKATNAYAPDIGSAMLVGVNLPTLGCWKIMGKYKDAELSFVVWVAP